MSVPYRRFGFSVPLLFVLVAAAGCSATGQFGEGLRAPQPPGYRVSSRANLGGIEHVEMVPVQSNSTESLRTEILKGGVEEGDPVRYAEWTSRRFKDRCPDPKISPVDSGERNGYPYALWRMDCPGLKAGGKPETVVVLAIQGSFAFYTVQKTWRSSPSEADVESWRRFYFDNVVLCDGSAHPCPSGPAGPDGAPASPNMLADKAGRPGA